MDFDGWIAGCKVRVFDWIDGKHIYMNAEYYKPGSSLSQKPAMEKSVLFDKADADKLWNNLHSIVNGIMFGGLVA